MYELIKWDQKCNSVGFEWKERLDEHNAVVEVVKNHSGRLRRTSLGPRCRF